LGYARTKIRQPPKGPHSPSWILKKRRKPNYQKIFGNSASSFEDQPPAFFHGTCGFIERISFLKGCRYAILSKQQIMSIKKSDFENYLSTYYLESNGVKLSLEGLLICVGNIGLKVIDWNISGRSRGPS